MATPTLQDYYTGKRVFVTGHTGFKGAWLLLMLHELGAEVCGYALEAENPSLYRSIDGDRYCTSIIADIRDADRLKQELLAFQPDVVIHMAAQPLVLDGYDRPAYTFDVNGMGTVYIMEALRQLTKPCAAVMVTTDKVYENKEVLTPYVETDRLGGRDPYSASKAIAELAIRSYAWSFFQDHPVRIAAARSGNVIGGGDWAANRIIPDVIRALMADEQVTVRNPHAVRPWQHVLDPLMGYLMLAMHLPHLPHDEPLAFNFGPDTTTFLTVEAVVQRVLHRWGGGSRLAAPKADAPHESGLLLLDASLAKQQLGWQPLFTQEQAIDHTTDWFVEVLRNEQSATAISYQHVRDYLAVRR
jgi:CDP-glucose 4,6-dehydratase